MSQRQIASVRYARIYDRLYRLGYHRRPDKSHAKVLAERALRLWNPESVLDVGCSIGWAVGYFADRGVRAVGVDVSAIAVRNGSRLGRDIRLACATHLPFDEASFDVVMSTDCLEHLAADDAVKAVREMCRVARRGIALKVNPRKDRDRLWKVIAGTSLHLTVQPVANWLEWFDAAGWSVLEGDDAREEYMLVPTAHR
jgi:SAM-dependent methyltransferase